MTVERPVPEDGLATGAPLLTAPVEVEETGFGPLRILFDDRVLRPRPWTLLQSRWAAELLPSLPGGDVLELCAGAGHIGLAAVLGSGRRLVQVDASEVACHYARLNRDRAGLSEAAVEVRHGLMEEVVAPHERFALVVADPPWVPTGAVHHFPDDPLSAIDGGHGGLDLARSCVDLAATHLLPGGRCIVQVGDEEQARAVEEYAATRPGSPHERPVRPLGRRVADGGALALLGA